MSDWSLGQGLTQNVRYPTFIDGTGVYYVLVQSGAIDTKGSWVEITSATDFDTDVICAHLPKNKANAGSVSLTDIGFGAPGSEVVLIPNICFGSNNQGASHEGLTLTLPIRIPAGTRLAVRTQCTLASRYIRCAVNLFAGNFLSNPGNKVVTYGHNVGTSHAIIIDPGATANTKGSWTELEASVDEDIKGFACSFDTGIGSIAQDDKHWLLDIGIGSSGNEVTIMGDFYLRSNAATDTQQPFSTHYMGIAIPKGSRLVGRLASTELDASDRLLGVMLHGVI